MIIPRPQIEPIPQDSVWSPPRFRLTKDYIFQLDDNAIYVIVPKTFETDLASTPRIVWALPGFSPTGPLIYGAIPHDFGYQYGYLLSPYNPRRVYPEASMRLRERYPEKFTDNIPIFVGAQQAVFDQLLSRMTIEVAKSSRKDILRKQIVACVTEEILSVFGPATWNKYRTKGPTAFNTNSLGIPGITKAGEVF